MYLRSLGLYCELEKTTPEQIIEEAESKKCRDGFTDFVLRTRVEFGRPPCTFVVRNNLSKARHRYFSLIGSEGILYIQDCLRRRVEVGEELWGEMPLLGFDPRGTNRNRFLRTHW